MDNNEKYTSKVQILLIISILSSSFFFLISSNLFFNLPMPKYKEFISIKFMFIHVYINLNKYRFSFINNSTSRTSSSFLLCIFPLSHYPTSSSTSQLVTYNYFLFNVIYFRPLSSKFISSCVRERSR